MAMQGSLQDMTVADLIQHTCQENREACLTIEHQNQQSLLFFQAGNIKHATLGEDQGEEVIYKILTWQEGVFTLEMNVPSPSTSITKNWSSLLLEGARRIDEATQTEVTLSEKEQDLPMATKKKSDLLAEALARLLSESSDIDGAAIVGVDGLVYSANVPQRALDEEMVGASSAAILGLSKRSVNQLKRGNFKQALVQGDEGNIIVISLNDETLFVGLTTASVNLGMAFAEMRTMAATLSEIL